MTERFLDGDSELNLSTHRATVSVWDRRGWDGTREQLTITRWMVGAAGAGQDAGPGTDFHAVANGFVSVTPLQVDLTRHGALEGVREWLKEPVA